MLMTMCSKLCALPVCVMAWISNYKYALPSSKINFNTVAQEFMKIAEETTLSSTNDVPYVKERVAMMCSILKRFMVQSGAKGKIYKLYIMLVHLARGKNELEQPSRRRFVRNSKILPFFWC